MSIIPPPGSRYGAVLDACVLVGFPVCDTLLRLAENQFYRPFWTEEILDEVKRTLVKSLGISPPRARKRIDQMNNAFPEAMALNIPEMRFGLPDLDDEHVLAAAIVTEAQAIVTFNLQHFPSEISACHDVEIIHPDAFLVHQFDLNPLDVRNAIYAQVGATRSPAYGVVDLLRKLQPQVPEFAERVKDEIMQDMQQLLESHSQAAQPQDDR